MERGLPEEGVGLRSRAQAGESGNGNSQPIMAGRQRDRIDAGRDTAERSMYAAAVDSCQCMATIQYCKVKQNKN